MVGGRFTTAGTDGLGDKATPARSPPPLLCGQGPPNRPPNPLGGAHSGFPRRLDDLFNRPLGEPKTVLLWVMPSLHLATLRVVGKSELTVESLTVARGEGQPGGILDHTARFPRLRSPTLTGTTVPPHRPGVIQSPGLPWRDLVPGVHPECPEEAARPLGWTGGFSPVRARCPLSRIRRGLPGGSWHFSVPLLRIPPSAIPTGHPFRPSWGPRKRNG